MNAAICSLDNVAGLSPTYQLTPCVQGGVVTVDKGALVASPAARRLVVLEPARTVAAGLVVLEDQVFELDAHRDEIGEVEVQSDAPGSSWLEAFIVRVDVVLPSIRLEKQTLKTIVSDRATL